MPQTEGLAPLQTVAALFDDLIDAEHALAALRKADRPAASVSVLARDRSGRGEPREGPIDVTRAVMDTALTAMSGWLLGLAALMVPESGTFLAAGPIGVALAKLKPESRETVGPDSTRTTSREVVGSVGLALEEFGFQANEAHYFERRLAAGSAMIAVTTVDERQVEATLRTFADYNAVFIGQAETPHELIDDTEQWLANPLAARSPEVIVADVVVTLRHACRDAYELGGANRRCGKNVLDANGELAGEIDDLLVDPSEDELVRYVVIGHGGVLGIARRRVAVPGEIVRFGARRARLEFDRLRLLDAPVYDAGVPFSRKDELAVHAFFGTEPYWVARSSRFL